MIYCMRRVFDSNVHMIKSNTFVWELLMTSGCKCWTSFQILVVVKRTNLVYLCVTVHCKLWWVGGAGAYYSSYRENLPFTESQ